ncbi:hypothetical protein BGZ94_003137 [Podila epigama]|nr:hypothetical protein BGZ94_003137 [Podila epigama]
MLLRRIPASRLHFNKRVVSLVQGENGVLIRCHNNDMYEADLLVGADGGNSAVRQALFSKLQQVKKLPAHDLAPPVFNRVTIVGQTFPLSRRDFPELSRMDSPFECVAADKGFGCVTFTTKADTICWTASFRLNKTTAKHNDPFRSTEWGPEGAEQMCRQVKDVPIVGGNGQLTIGDLIEMSPKHLITKLVIEEKVFKTWYSDRTVLLGDACHRMNPAGGMNAAVLANWINTLGREASMNDITEIFREYKNERYGYIQERFQMSVALNQMRTGSLQGRLARFLVRNMPRWAKSMAGPTGITCRPQVSFLPLVKDTGAMRPVPQQSLEKTLLILKRKQEEAQRTAVSL